MKIFVIHGDHTLNSYERLQSYVKKARSKEWEIINIDKSTNSVKEEILGQSLFNEKRLLVIKDVKLLTPSLVKWIKNNEGRINCSLIIYHNNIIPKRALNTLPNPEKLEEYKIPKLIWSFLDSLFPGNVKNIYKLFHEVIKNEAVEFVFAMLARQFRDIYWAKVDPKTMDYPAWRVSKLKKLASHYKKNELEKIIEELSLVDINSKTSQASLENSLDFLMVKYLE
ncbi:MAG: hypothetical protein JW870_07905 [Candidatus Delongbacteria bacterium]|nr:hypothetical protein [Candidatus Delongbacteria bacterium]